VFEAGVAYSKEREQFGRPISSFQGVQFQLAQMATEIEAARLLVYNAARLKMSGKKFIKQAAMAKLLSSQVAQKVASAMIDLYGGNGFTKEYPVEKYYRDSKIGTVYEGTTNMQLQTIAKILLSE
jgi:alkylation response protein AidB-like acyl-CoA dehydrogenase